GVANTDVRFYVSGEDLLVRLVGSSTDSILIKRWFDTSDLRYGYKIEEFVFEDGVRLTAADVEAGTVLDGTPGDDSISGRGAADVITGLEGDDRLYGQGGDDIIAGGEGDDELYGGSGNDVLYGGAGADTLFGDTGDDVLDGGEGNDTLIGGGATTWGSTSSGSDTYVFARGYGHDTVQEYGRPDEIDTLRVTGGLTAADVTLSQRDENLVVTIRDTEESVTIEGFFLPAWDRPDEYPYAIERIVFDDSTEWGIAEIKARTLWGTDGADVLVGFDTDDLIVGSGGDDYMIGGRGRDTYLIGANQGSDVIDHDSYS